MLYNLLKSNQASSMFPWNGEAPKCVYEREGAKMGGGVQRKTTSDPKQELEN